MLVEFHRKQNHQRTIQVSRELENLAARLEMEKTEQIRAIREIELQSYRLVTELRHSITDKEPKLITLGYRIKAIYNQLRKLPYPWCEIVDA